MRVAYALIVVAASLLIATAAELIGEVASVPEGSNYGIGSSQVLIAKYRTYRAQQLKSPSQGIVRIGLGYVKGLSRSFTATVGELALDLETGRYEITLDRMLPSQTYTVWLVDRQQKGAQDTVVNLG